MVGRVGVEPTTSRLSGVRSNHLSYRPRASADLRPAFARSDRVRSAHNAAGHKAAGGVSQLRRTLPLRERFPG